MKIMDELSRWYENMTYQEAKGILQEKLDYMKKNFIAAGYYMKYIRDHELYREDGYESIWEFAEDNYGIKKSTASRWMSMNDKFSQGGNSPVLAEEFRHFEKSQLQEMMYLDDKQIEAVTSDMTVKEIREVRKPVEPEVKRLKKPDETDREYLNAAIQSMWNDVSLEKAQEAQKSEKEEKTSPINRGCITGKNTNGNCVCCGKDGVECCGQCDDDCNSRCGWIDSAVATSQQDEPVVDMNPLGEESDQSDIELLQEELDKAKNNLDLILSCSCYSENDIRARKQKLLVGALAGMISDLDAVDIPEPQQPELPIFKNNDQRKAWLRDYKVWGLWYEDKNIGAKYYKYDFENGARLIVEEYTQPATEWHGEFISSFMHLVGGPEPPKKGCVSKWQRHEVYNRFQNNETELVEFLKYAQKNRQNSAD